MSGDETKAKRFLAKKAFHFFEECKICYNLKIHSFDNSLNDL